MATWQVVDLGTKKGGAIAVFRRHHGLYFPKQAIAPNRCLGIDLQDKYSHYLTDQGCAFLATDVTDPKFVFPEADYYLGFHFLEHLPSVDVSQWVVAQMLAQARKGVWLRMPSFEAVPGLTALGLRFAWTRWHGHPSALKLEHVVPLAGPRWTVTVKPATPSVASTHHPAVVPEGAPIDTTAYDESLGRRPLVTLDPPIAGSHEVLFRPK